MVWISITIFTVLAGNSIVSIEFQNIDTKVTKTKREAPHSTSGPPPINYRKFVILRTESHSVV